MDLCILVFKRTAEKINGFVVSNKSQYNGIWEFFRRKISICCRWTCCTSTMYDNFQIHSNTSPSVNSSLHDYTSHLHRENESPLCKWHFKKTSKKERANIISESGWEHVLKRRLPAASRRTTYWRNNLSADSELRTLNYLFVPMS